MNAHTTQDSPPKSGHFSEPFVIKDPNFTQSPHTGMTRRHWMEAGKHILEGVFQYVDSMDSPMLLPKMPGKSYPKQGNEMASPAELSAASLEALARTFNVAAPLIHNSPDLTLHGIHLGDYYKHHFLQLLTNEDHEYFIGLASLKSRKHQQTCELGSLAVSCMLMPNVFWGRLNEDEKAAVAKMLLDWGKGRTHPHNWRWFNVMMLTLLEIHGYESDSELIRSHVDHLILHHAGDGWYRDMGYDYYTIHVFHLYGAVWNKYYGKGREPARAKIIEEQFRRFQTHYPMLFGREGQVNMYGRSIIYRLGAIAGMPAAFLEESTPILDPGVARRISSGALLQFICHQHFFQKGIPSLGFYGPFEPAIQGYSCSASPYWMFLGFMALALPEECPFWSAVESDGHWEQLKKRTSTVCLEGPGLHLSNHGSTGTSELRPGKIHNVDPNYCRLAYNTAFPWEDNALGGPVSSTLSLRSHDIDEREELPKFVDFAGYRDGVLYRQASFTGLIPPHVDMATIVVPHGEIRVDRLRKISTTTLYLGHFSMPHLNGVPPRVVRSVVDGYEHVCVSIPGRQLAVTRVSGWQSIGIKENIDLHPESRASSLLHLQTEDLEHRFGKVEILISILLHKADDSPFEESDRNPIRSITSLGKDTPMHLGGLRVHLKTGEAYDINFDEIDGCCSRH